MASSSRETHRGKKIAVSLGDLLTTNEVVFEIDAEDEEFYDDQQDPYFDMTEQANLDCIDSSNPEALPFEELATKMTDIWAEGKVKKRILRAGTVEFPDDAALRVHYNCYTEMDEFPFDSTYVRSKYPVRYQLGEGSFFFGFEIALQSMTVGEKAQFLIHPDLAFGALGMLNRIPPNATVMMIAEVIRLDLSPEEEPLSIQDRKDFNIIYKRAKHLNSQGNHLVMEGLYFQAITMYRRAEDLLTGTSLNSDEQETKYKKLLTKIYINMSVCYHPEHMNYPKKTCIAIRKAFEVDPKNAHKNPKLFYHKGVALMALADYKKAKVNLMKAQQLAPDDENVKKQLGVLERMVQSVDAFKNEFSFPDLDKDQRYPLPLSGVVPDVIDDECKAAVSRLLEDFAQGNQSLPLNLSSEYTPAEREWLKSESNRLKLEYKETSIGPNRFDIVIVKKGLPKHVSG